jgi:transcriptional antiterminator RfaH
MDSYALSAGAAGVKSGLPAADMTRWYLAFSKPKQEELARQQLVNQGYEAYLPLFKKLGKPRSTTSPDSAGLVREPMFPRYVFFKPGSAAQSISAARSTRGVTSLVRFGFIPATVSDDLIDAIRALELEREQADLDQISPYQPGTRVRLREKGLQCLEGLVVSVSSKRVTLLLEILGREKELTVEHSKLELA